MISSNVFPKVLVLIAIILLVACKPAPPPTIGQIKTKLTTVTTGGKTSLTIDVAGTDLKFAWSALRGSLTDPTLPNVIYTAPDSPGPDTVTVKVTYAGGETIRTIDFDVVEPPPAPTPTPSDTSVPAETPVPIDTPLSTAVPEPIGCDLPPITKNVFSQLADVEGQFPMYGPAGDPNFYCEGVYDLVHEQTMAIHLKYDKVGTNVGWFGIATPNGYDASKYRQVCFWAYAKEPNQSFRVKMKDTTKKEKGVITTIEVPNKWTKICTDISKIEAQGIQPSKMDNVNLGFEAPMGSSEIWVAEFEFK